MGREAIETLFYVSSTVFLYWLIISEGKVLLISLTYKMLLLLLAVSYNSKHHDLTIHLSRDYFLSD